MKKLLILAVLTVFIGIIIITIERGNNTQFERMKTRLNSRIAELSNEGYSLKASKHIAFVEFGMIPKDKEYNSLIED
jgi:uncharacterized membrane protein